MKIWSWYYITITPNNVIWEHEVRSSTQGTMVLLFQSTGNTEWGKGKKNFLVNTQEVKIKSRHDSEIKYMHSSLVFLIAEQPVIFSKTCFAIWEQAIFQRLVQPRLHISGANRFSMVRHPDVTTTYKNCPSQMGININWGTAELDKKLLE